MARVATRTKKVSGDDLPFAIFVDFALQYQPPLRQQITGVFWDHRKIEDETVYVRCDNVLKLLESHDTEELRFMLSELLISRDEKA